MIRKTFLLLLLTSFLLSQSFRTSRVIDDCGDAKLWSAFQSTGVEVKHAIENSAIRFDIMFPKGSGYGGVFRNFNTSLPENYEISFMMKATVPVNNFEVKASDDSAGSTIWWVNNKSYTYPTDWKRIVIKKRHLGFAWGPNYAPYPSKLSRLEIVVTAGTGGKGSVWIDDVTLTTLPTAPKEIPQPSASASSIVKGKGDVANVLPGRRGMWISRSKKNEWIELDLKYEKEFGAINLVWDQSLKGLTYDIQTSFDKKKYETISSISNGKSGNVFHFLPESEARYVRLVLKENATRLPFKLEEFTVIASESLSTPNHFFERIASSSPIGLYPRYFLKQQPYWTVVGVPSDTREALFNEDGVFEVDKQRFSIEPFIVLSNKVMHWENGKNEQSLDENYLPIPTVTRTYENIALRTTLLATGEAGRSSVIARYVVKNISVQDQKGALYLALRPFQVNPTSQWLNYDGGFAKTNKIAIDGNRATVDDKTVIVSGTPSAFGATAIEQGDITDFIVQNTVPQPKSVGQPHGMTSGAFQYSFDLKAGDSLVVIAAVPFTREGNLWTDKIPTSEEFQKTFEEVRSFWKKTLNTVEFNVPSDAQRLVNIIRSNLAYILINKDKFGFQPGSRSYERSWIRDGSMTSDALLKLGITEEPKKYLEWYAPYQYESGSVPCVVDTRGPDPVPEHDSHGQLIFACMEYFRFTKDTAFLGARWDNIVAAVNFIQSLRAQRMTPEFRDGNDEKRAFYGLVTESISHEGYSDKAMHSYWDNFFVLKGLKDASATAAVLGKQKEAREYDSLAKAFRTDLYNSIALAMKNRKIDYIPGCVEKGDFDATSTSIALFPNGEMKFVPQPAYDATFDKYFDWFVQRAENKLQWDAYTPYEIRNVGTFIYLGQKERAHYLLDYFLKDQRPQRWNHWAEVVANGYRTMRFIGDMPHTWVGSDYINAIRAMFVYEIDDEHSIVVGAGLKEEWLREGLSVKKLPTHYGELSYSVAASSDGSVSMRIEGTVDAKKTPLLIPVTLRAKQLQRVSVNGVSVTPENGFIMVQQLPASVELRY
ncbi:MAG: discoidin domain-containing protein [Ignavibacteriales bacterium]|nr:discoidin domain-containing protein [Ignavibacteriales bacterium]